MKTNKDPGKKNRSKLFLFLEREMSITLLFWIIVFLIVAIVKILS
jgi:hypothetical protein